jgi:flagellar protein FlaG
MAVQYFGNIGGTTPQPLPSSGSTPRPVAPQRDAAPVETLPQASPPPEQPSQEQLKQAVEEIRKSVSQAASSSLQFAIDDESGQTIVRVTDRQTGELIRQIPSVEMLELARSLDRMQGMLLRQKA